MLKRGFTESTWCHQWFGLSVGGEGVGLNPTADTKWTSLIHGEHADKLHRLHNIYGHSSTI